MKRYKIEPTYKKSVIEYNSYRKELEDGTILHATMELGWRWGEFEILVPETEAEVLEWAQDKMGVDDTYFSSVTEVFEDYGEENYEGMKQHFLPAAEEEFHELDDYVYEMNSTWDGCWEDWTVQAFGEHNDKYDVDELREQVEEGWGEESWDYMEKEGWEELDCYFEIHCPLTIEEVEDRPDVDVSSDFKDDR